MHGSHEKKCCVSLPAHPSWTGRDHPTGTDPSPTCSPRGPFSPRAAWIAILRASRLRFFPYNLSLVQCPRGGDAVFVRLSNYLAVALYLSPSFSLSHRRGFIACQSARHDGGEGRTWLLLRLTIHTRPRSATITATSQPLVYRHAQIALTSHRLVSVASVEVLYIQFWPAHPRASSTPCFTRLLQRNCAQRRKIIGLTCSFSNPPAVFCLGQTLCWDQHIEGF